MNSNGTNTIGPSEVKGVSLAAKSTRFALGIALTLLLSSPAFAQYGGGGTGGTGTTGMPGTPGYSSPGYGSGKAIGIGVGAAAAGAVLLYVALHHHHHQTSVTGCVQSSDSGLSLADEKNKKTFSLVSAGADLKAGERVEVAGKKSAGPGGVESFQATKLVKNLGACGAPAVTAANH